MAAKQALLDDLVARLEACGLASRAAIADSPGAAWAVARFTDEALSIVPPGGAKAVLAPLPVAGLRLSGDIIEALQAVGLRRIGDLLSLPRAPLAARFGEILPKRLDQAMGAADEPISPRLAVPAMASRIAFAEPIGKGEDIALAARHLLAELCSRLAAAHQGARRLELRLYRTDATAAAVAIGTSRPERELKHLERLFAEKLTGIDAGFGIDAVVLGALVVEPLAPSQAAMAFAGETKPDGLARLIDSLGNRLGPERVVMLRERASHLPERACAEVPAFAAGSRQATAAAAAAVPAQPPLCRPLSARASPGRCICWPGPSPSTSSPPSPTARRCCFAGADGRTGSPPPRGRSASRPSGGSTTAATTPSGRRRGATTTASRTKTAGGSGSIASAATGSALPPAGSSTAASLEQCLS